jgi:hemerythrin superfamily protein
MRTSGWKAKQLRYNSKIRKMDKKGFEKLRDELYKKFEKIEGVEYPDKECIYGEALEFSEEEGDFYGTIGFSFQMDDRVEDIDLNDVQNETVKNLEELLKGTIFEGKEVDYCSDRMDAFPNAYSANKVILYLTTEEF